MIKLKGQFVNGQLIINMVIAKTLLDKLQLCKDGCDCGCASGVELCKDGCDCGCADPASKIDACKDGCDCGCASGVELCKDGCDCGCQDNVQTTDGGQCNCEHCQESSQTAFAGGSDDGNDDNEKKTQNQTINNSSNVGDASQHNQAHNGHHHHHHHHNNQHQCGCGCEHHDGQHQCEHHGEGEHQCDCGCDHGEQPEQNACESERNLANEYLALARQIQADFDNYRRRNTEAVKQAKSEGVREAVLDFLPALDAVDRAMEYIKDEQSLEGIKLIRKIFEKTFADFHIEPIMCLGAHYDPNFHDVVVAEESTQPSGTIIEEIETGYTMDGKVIRHSIVKIAK